MSTHHYRSPAKINWFLHITERLPNGYHSLETVFQKIDWYDDIEIELLNHPHIELTGDLSDLAPEHNLIYRAAQALQRHAQERLKQHPQSHNPNSPPIPLGARIHLRKHIPMGAGLGGGSSNAATVLNALNHLWQLDLDPSTLADFAVKLGADVPFFVQPHSSAFAQGIGEQLTPISLPACTLLLIKPQAHASTQAVYQHQDLERNHPKLTQTPQTLSALIPQLNAQSPLGNSMQSAAFAIAPEIRQVYDTLRALLPEAYIRMSGSGATVFAYVQTPEQTTILQNWQTQAPPQWQYRWCQTLTQVDETLVLSSNK